ncbi:hypothetical protein IP92_03422 [Pseudoduganella flava]|uniref:Periplasmic heavy metal sensor n=1 Tax=Pseudoduganella flava TaxID=871742 RepID=A0A562PNE5_9BURK|nr:hypothetical protein [Pseudoduganella flava]QGZ40544.1 hypothetical protein GO485_16755 [Pseudoduganella flava]TWI45991.1 hypothetical protein IP92_03422 [Pseudoduganella flava]
MNVFKRSAAAVAAALLLAGPALALPMMEMRAQDLLMMAPDLKQALKLTPNQATLWSQTESRTRTLLRERQSREEKLQAATLQALQGKDVELRELTAALDAESRANAAEEQQLREWWLTVNDALDDTQRRAVAVFLAEQLQRKPEGPGGSGGPARGEGGEGRGGHRGGPGGGMGGGAGGGKGGINIGL